MRYREETNETLNNRLFEELETLQSYLPETPSRAPNWKPTSKEFTDADAKIVVTILNKAEAILQQPELEQLDISDKLPFGYVMKQLAPIISEAYALKGINVCCPVDSKDEASELVKVIAELPIFYLGFLKGISKDAWEEIEEEAKNNKNLLHLTNESFRNLSPSMRKTLKENSEIAEDLAYKLINKTTLSKQDKKNIGERYIAAKFYILGTLKNDKTLEPEEIKQKFLEIRDKIGDVLLENSKSDPHSNLDATGKNPTTPDLQKHDGL